MAQDLDRILERVRKLLAVAGDDRANEGERDNALRMANNLMAKHQLDASMIPTEQRDRDDPLGRFDGQGFSTVWIHHIRNHIGRLFDCRYLMGEKVNATQQKFIYVGRASGATSAMLMAEWIVRAAIKEADRIGGHRLSKNGRSCGTGFAYRLGERVSEILRTQAASVALEHNLDVESTGRALMVIHSNALAEADEWMADNMKVRDARKARHSHVNADAWYAGAAAANRVNLSKKVNETPEPAALR